MALKHWKHNKQYIICAENLSSKAAGVAFDPKLFEPKFLMAEGRVYATAEGRGTSFFFRECHQNWILKHYWRGGLMGKLCKDHYFPLPLKLTRPYQELQLLSQLSQLNLPAPKPIAARVVYHGCYYQADIITSAISDSFSLVQKLNSTSTLSYADTNLWEAIGKTIKRFHQYNIYHDDLNAHNILIDQQGEVFLIDFDKGKQITANIKSNLWKKNNLNRLHRSLLKEKNKKIIKGFNKNCWEKLLRGYGH